MKIKTLQLFPYKLIAIVIMLGLFAGCMPKNVTQFKGTLDGAIAQAKKENKYLFVVATAGDCNSCDGYIEKIKQALPLQAELASDFILYECDLNTVGNEYFFRAVYNIASPTTYIYSPEGLIKAVITGNRPVNELIETVQQVRNNRYQNTDKNVRLGLEGQEQLTFYNQVMRLWKIVESNASNTQTFKEALEMVNNNLLRKEYMFNHYLASKLYQKVNEDSLAQQHAMKSLDFKESFDLYLYQPLRNEMKFVADENYKDTKEPYLVFKQTSYNYGVQGIKSRPKASFFFKNTGKSPLVIYKAFGNCDCMDIEWPEDPIQPGKEGQVDVIYHADHEGGFSKVIYVSTNALNAQAILNLKGSVEQ